MKLRRQILPGSRPALLCAGLLCAFGNSRAADADLFSSSLASMSITQLMDIKISIIGPAEAVSQTPAAVSVVTQDDIQRMGAMNIPEALRLVPGMDVAQLDANQWAVSARGFNDVFANKLLVLQDGRSIYTPLFSGVFWDVQGTMMQDIDRIEVVRGPGATLWGANAVNGVINIITKSAKDTQGMLVTGGGGAQELGFGAARYGGKISENAYGRVYAMYNDHDHTVLPDGSAGHNSWQLVRGGFRTDWNIAGRDVNDITFQGDAYAGWMNQVYSVYDTGAVVPPFFTATPDQERVRGGNVLGRWTHTFSENSDFKLQLYYDRTERDVVIFDENRDTFDLDLRHRFSIGDRNNVMWGLGYRVTSDTERNNPTISFVPARQTVNLFSGFIQDEIALVKSSDDQTRLGLTLGSKFEHNDYTGAEIEPGVRLFWLPAERHTLWASVSRAVRTPSRAEEGVALTQPTPTGLPATIYGNQNFLSEKLMAYEIGYRARPLDKLSYDLAAFYNVYDDLRSVEAGPSPTQPFNPATIPLHLGNRLSGDTFGVEASATWNVAGWWRLQPAYTFLKMELHKPPGSADTLADNGKSPEHQISLRSDMDFPHDVSFDLAFRYVDRLTAIQTPGYFTFDARLAWQINRHVEIAIAGQNLAESHHAEFSPSFIANPPGEIPRSVFGTITLRF